MGDVFGNLGQLIKEASPSGGNDSFSGFTQSNGTELQQV